ncbi:hypothetical protein AYO38_05400 [bacterium SCGC AG-212-C10]|nr:hypothetical protein AYO38_05400 [bacterium SCGC AG-212-C10]
MPEGDSLYRFAARLRPVLEGQVILGARSHGPGPVPQVARIVGAMCTGVSAVGKNLLIDFDNGLTLRGHLRMYGTWHVYKPGELWRKPERDARLILEVDGATVVNFTAPVIELLETRAVGLHQPVSGLGPNLIDEDFDEDEVLRRFREPSRAMLTMGDAVMDQRVMAGVGNIWKHETLFRCKLYPWRLVRDMSDEDLRAVIAMARSLLRQSVGKDQPRGHARRPAAHVYGRSGQGCPRCHSRILRASQGRDIRGTAWCPTCQPRREDDPAPGWVSPAVRDV